MPDQTSVRKLVVHKRLRPCVLAGEALPLCTSLPGRSADRASVSIHPCHERLPDCR